MVQDFDFTINPIKGNKNGLANFVSRLYSDLISHLCESFRHKENVQNQCFTNGSLPTLVEESMVIENAPWTGFEPHTLD